ncbi:hypothetical protein QJS10_CPB19g00966 [Acorus calamus]|uniref:Reduced growth phenotype protein 1 n=1 Tax=Acorus calamus TaxID=4465 RepID=A0AAV9CI32_ACOCL|nr:hypothetical protein QJS10_CPB19g00966 [Acorus calamus]
MSMKVARGFSIFGRGGGDENVDNPTLKYEFSPSLKIQTDKEIYRPGDTITTTIEIVSPEVRNGTSEAERGNNNAFSLMVESLIFEVKGIEKLDTQWFVTQKPSSGSKQRRGILPPTTVQMDIYWKEKDAESEWARASEISEDEGYDSSRDEISSVSSYNPPKGNIDHSFRNSISMQSLASRASNEKPSYSQDERSFPSYMPLSQLSVAEVVDDSGGAEGFVRGRSYNIKIDDQVLLRFSPKNSDSTYYFGDTVSITLETSETVSQQFVHPSRRSSPTITKIQSDRHEVVADLLQTSFLFSIPMDGPMSFSTPYISVQWVLRFEFFTTPKNVDWSRYEHPLLVGEREKGEWVLPIMVHAPPPRGPPAHPRNDRPI